MSQDDPNKKRINPETLEPLGIEDDGLERIHLEPCPCGKTPKMLMVELETSKKRGHTFGDCCGEWMIEFNNNYNVDKEKMADKAKVAWNRATRQISS